MHTCAEDIQNFLYNLQVQEASKDLRPISWLEIFALYHIRGFKHPIPDPENKAKGKATIAKQLAEFKKVFRGVVSRIVIDSEHTKLFIPVKSLPNGLIGIGINGKHAAPSYNIAISDKERKDIASSLIHASRNITIKKLMPF